MKNLTINQTAGLFVFPIIIMVLSACASINHTHPATTNTIVKHDTIRINDCKEGKEIAILSASINNMYFNCGNIISADVPPNATNISLQATNATVLPSTSSKNKFSVIPTSKLTVLDIDYTLNGTSVSKKRNFKVIRTPHPTVQLAVNGKIYNGSSIIPKKSNLSLRIKPDADFKSMLPRDARYVISKVDLLVQRSLGAPVKIGSFSGEGKNAETGIQIPLGNKLKSDPPGTKVILKIDKVFRVNFQNKKIEVPLSEINKTLSLTIK